MRLGIDLDGVVANFTQGWMNFYNRDFGTNLVIADSQHWGDLVGLTHFKHINEFWEWSSDLDGHSVFWHLDPFPGAVEAIRSLVDEGHQIVVITTKPDFAVNDTYLPGLVEHRADRTVCRYVRPWNSPIDGVVDVHDFDEFRDVVDQLTKLS